MKTRSTLLVIAAFLAASGLDAQRIDYNDVYRFPLSFGFEYQSLSPFQDYGFTPTAYYDLSLCGRVPIPALPSLQAFVKIGMITLVPPAIEDQWAHRTWYLMPGIAYIHRFSKTIEVGVEAAVGVSEAVFPRLDPEAVRGAPMLLADVGARVALDPSYNFSLDVHPRVLFQVALNPLTNFNGASLGIGFSASYRLGDDPDDRKEIRSIRFGTIEVPPVYPAMQKWYADTPESLGRVTVTNTEKFDLASVKVSFFQNGYMDSATTLAEIPVLEAGASVEVGVKALFNDGIFLTEGVTRVTGELVAEYLWRGKEVTQKVSVPCTLLDRRSISWSDDLKVGAFITPQDSALGNFMSFIATDIAPDAAAPGIAKPLMTAMQTWAMLKALRCVYVPDPKMPFTSVQGRVEIVDQVNLARQTLKQRTGDCDDLTVLFCSLLEAVGIPTAYLLVPGHIYAAFDTGVAAASWQEVHPEKRMTFTMEGRLWVPIEVTLIEKSDFLAAWRRGVEEWEEAVEHTPLEARFVLTDDAQKVYAAMGLQWTDLGMQYGNPQTMAAAASAARESAEKLVTAIVDASGQSARAGGTKREYNRFGLVCAKFGRYDQAEQAFTMALSLDRTYLTARLNWGNVMVLKQQFPEALQIYHEGLDALATLGADAADLRPLFLVNLSRCYYELEDYEKSSRYFEQATTADPGLTDRFAYLKAAAGEGRQAAAAPKEDLLWRED